MEIRKIMEKIRKEYDKDPRNWSFWLSKDKNGEFYDMFVVHRDECYVIKLDSIFGSNPIGIGKKVKVDGVLFEKFPESGFRKLSKGEIKDFLRNPNKIMKKEPVPLSVEAVSGDEIGIIGPQFMSEKPILISKEQEKLDKKLSGELRKIIKRDNPMFQ